MRPSPPSTTSASAGPGLSSRRSARGGAGVPSPTPARSPPARDALGVHADRGAPGRRGRGARGRPAVFCEKPWTVDLARPVPRRRRRRRRGAQPVRARLRSAPVFRGLRDLVRRRHPGPADGCGVPRRPVLPDPGQLPVAVAGGRGPGRRRLPDRALHPRRRHLALLLRRGRPHRGSHRRTTPATSHGGPRRGLALLFVGPRGTADQRLARDLQPGLDSADRGLLPRRHGVARRRLPGATARRRPATGPRSGPAPRPDGSTPSRWPTTPSAWPCAPTSRPTAPSSTPSTSHTSPEPGLDVALAAHRLVDAAYRSAAHGGEPVDLRRATTASATAPHRPTPPRQVRRKDEFSPHRRHPEVGKRARKPLPTRATPGRPRPSPAGRAGLRSPLRRVGIRPGPRCSLSPTRSHEQDPGRRSTSVRLQPDG